MDGLTPAALQLCGRTFFAGARTARFFAGAAVCVARGFAAARFNDAVDFGGAVVAAAVELGAALGSPSLETGTSEAGTSPSSSASFDASFAGWAELGAREVCG
jgi:hypothetical protein